jgi:hypothetical protein
MASSAILYRKLSFILALLCLNGISFGATKVPQSNPLRPLVVDHVEKGTLFFKANAPGVVVPPPLKTDLYEIHPLAVLTGENTPYVLFEARTCENCNQEATLYAIKTNGESPSSFVFPGRIIDPKSRAVVYESRAFYGHCVSNRVSDVYIVFQKERIDRRNRLQQSVLVAEPTTRFMSDKLYETGLPRLSDTLKLVKAKRCSEVEGHNRMMSRRPIDLKVHHDDDDEDEDSPDEDKGSTPSGP